MQRREEVTTTDLAQTADLPGPLPLPGPVARGLRADDWQALVTWECEVGHADTERRLREFLDATDPTQ